MPFYYHAPLRYIVEELHCPLFARCRRSEKTYRSEGTSVDALELLHECAGPALHLVELTSQTARRQRR